MVTVRSLIAGGIIVLVSAQTTLADFRHRPLPTRIPEFTFNPPFVTPTVPRVVRTPEPEPTESPISAEDQRASVLLFVPDCLDVLSAPSYRECMACQEGCNGPDLGLKNRCQEGVSDSCAPLRLEPPDIDIPHLCVTISPEGDNIC